MKVLRAALCLAALAWGVAGAQTFNPLAPYGTISDTSPQLCVQGGNNFVCASGLLVTGSIASYVYTTNGSPANLSYLNPSTLICNPYAYFTQAIPCTLGSGLSFVAGALTATGSGSPYNPAAVAITGGTISGVTISGSTITLWTIGTGASSTGCAATSVNIGAASNAATGQGGGSLLSGTSGICAVVFTLPAVGHYWDCTAHDVTLQVNFVMTATSATGCTISYPTQSGDLVTLNFQGS